MGRFCQALGRVMNKLQKLSEEFNVAVLLTNQVLQIDVSLQEAQSAHGRSPTTPPPPEDAEDMSLKFVSRQL